MADTTTKSVLSLVATSSSRIRELPIKDGNLIFVQDIGRIAFDFKGKRVFYNQIVELNTEADRLALEDPLDGYYFVLGSGILWLRKGDWIQITERPKEIVQIGIELPQIGQEGKLYVTTKEGEENISVYDENSSKYVVVADKTQSMTVDEVIALFNKK